MVASRTNKPVPQEHTQTADPGAPLIKTIRNFTLTTSVTDMMQTVIGSTVRSWLNEWGALRGRVPYASYADALVRAIVDDGDYVGTSGNGGNAIEVVDRRSGAPTAPGNQLWGVKWDTGQMVQAGEVVGAAFVLEEAQDETDIPADLPAGTVIVQKGAADAATIDDGAASTSTVYSSSKVVDLVGEPILPNATSTPTAATDTVVLFGRKLSGRMFPAFVGPSGLDSALQPLLARNKVGYWNPPGNATTVPGVFGFTAPTVTGFTATARNVATTNMFTRMRRLGYVTAATAGTVGHWRVGVYQYTVGSSSTNLGGFTYIIRFGISDAASVSGARMFIGMHNSATPSNVEPSTLTNCVGIGHGASDTTMHLYYGGSSAQTPIDLGASFPADTQSTDVYELALFSPPNSGDVSYLVTRVNTGDEASGTITNSGSTVLPTNTTLLAPWGYRTNNATALAVGLDVMSAYIETDQ